MVPLARHARVREPPGASSTARPSSPRSSPLGREPWFGRDAIRTAACWAGILDSAVEAALDRPRDEAGDRRPEGARRGTDRDRPATIDRWFEYAARSIDGASRSALRQAIADAGRTILDEASRATGSRPFATGTALDRARRDFELFVLQHRLDPFVARLRPSSRIEARADAR